MLVLGLTGSIAMGKSHAVRIFRAFGVPVFDADAEVHALQAKGGRAVSAVAAAFPAALSIGGAIDRQALGSIVFQDAVARRRLERILHPLVREAERLFLARMARGRQPIALLDIPLLFETGAERRCDHVVVVSALPLLQTQRAMARPGMTPAKLAGIRGRQIPERVKRRRAGFVINSGLDRGHMVGQIGAVLRTLQGEPGGAWPARWRAAGVMER